MKNSKKRINIIDLVSIVVLIAVLIFVGIKFRDVKETVTSDAETTVTYIVEIQNQDPEILNYFKVDDKVYEDNSLKELGVVTSITQKPYTVRAEDKKNKRILEKEYPGKINVYVEVIADGVINNEIVSVDSVNILIGKTVNLNIGDSAATGVIIGLENSLKAKEETLQ